MRTLSERETDAGAPPSDCPFARSSSDELSYRRCRRPSVRAAQPVRARLPHELGKQRVAVHLKAATVPRMASTVSHVRELVVRVMGAQRRAARARGARAREVPPRDRAVGVS